jgi:hypothetical protein
MSRLCRYDWILDGELAIVIGRYTRSCLDLRETWLGMETRNCDYVTRLSVTNHVDIFLRIRHEIYTIREMFGLVVVSPEVDDVNDPWGGIINRHTNTQHFLPLYTCKLVRDTVMIRTGDST